MYVEWESWEVISEKWGDAESDQEVTENFWQVMNAQISEAVKFQVG